MNLLDSLRGQQPQRKTRTASSVEDAMQQLTADPRSIMIESGYKIPENVTDPKQIAMYILQTNQLQPRMLNAMPPVMRQFIQMNMPRR